MQVLKERQRASSTSLLVDVVVEDEATLASACERHVERLELLAEGLVLLGVEADCVAAGVRQLLREAIEDLPRDAFVRVGKEVAATSPVEGTSAQSSAAAHPLSRAPGV